MNRHGDTVSEYQSQVASRQLTGSLCMPGECGGCFLGTSCWVVGCVVGATTTSAEKTCRCIQPSCQMAAVAEKIRRRTLWLDAVSKGTEGAMERQVPRSTGRKARRKAQSKEKIDGRNDMKLQRQARTTFGTGKGTVTAENFRHGRSNCMTKKKGGCVNS